MPKTGVEYATDQITVYRHCPYQCTYCYVWRNKLFSYRVRQGKYDPVVEAKKYLRKKGRTIVVSFCSDPYPPEEEEKLLTRRVLEVLAENKENRILVLTKNPGLALRDIDVMKKHGDIWLGTTIITLNPVFARKLEPRAPSVIDRIEALIRAHEQGVKTWVSIEPIIPYVTYPDDIVRAVHEFVDWFVLGAFNYYKRIRLPDIIYIVDGSRYGWHGGWREETIYLSILTEAELEDWYRTHVPVAIELLRKYDKQFFIKKELRKWLEKKDEERKGPSARFWSKWFKANELERIRMAEELADAIDTCFAFNTDKKLRLNCIASLLKSYFEDLEEYLRTRQG